MRCRNREGEIVILQDNDPSHNNAKATESLKAIGAEVVEIPPRSPNLNPIENSFHNLKRKLRREALDKKIVCEDLGAFKRRIIETICTYDKNVIHRIISSMHKRLIQITKNHGC